MLSSLEKILCALEFTADIKKSYQRMRVPCSLYEKLAIHWALAINGNID